MSIPALLFPLCYRYLSSFTRQIYAAYLGVTRGVRSPAYREVVKGTEKVVCGHVTTLDFGGFERFLEVSTPLKNMSTSRGKRAVHSLEA